MKKLLIATAALAMVAGTAQAQSSVTVYGVLSTGYESMKLNDGEGNEIKQTTTGRQGAQAGSRLGFRGTEDLGGGTRAGFTLEMAADMTAGLGGVRVGFLDLGNKQLGTLRAGRVDSLTRQVVNTYTSHANSGFEAGNTASSLGRFASMGLSATQTAYNNSASYTADDATQRATRASRFAESAADTAALTWGQGAGRTSNTIGYISPSFGGVTFQAQIGKVESDVSNIDGKTVAQDTQAFGLAYNAGKLSVMAATSQEKAKSIETNKNSNNGETKNKTDIFGATYDFTVAKVFAMYTDRNLKRENGTYSSNYSFGGEFYGRQNYNTDQKDTTVGVSVPLGKVVLVGSYSDGEIKGVDTAANGDTYAFKSDVKGYQLQANYLLSKRTRAYVMMGETKLKNEENTSKLKGYVAGVQHSF
jgi:predicted porin